MAIQHVSAPLLRRLSERMMPVQPSPAPHRPPALPWLAAALVSLCVNSHASSARTAALADLSLEQLSNVVVSTVSRREESVNRVAASVFVISHADIRRSAATSLPEALRLAPMLQVARVDSSRYAISARGFNNPLANNMLVLIDGRTVYTPLFSGVFWEAQDVMLDDVERIEVITGPNTALWGTNAVNGLIHIITRSAAQTQGVTASINKGNRERSGAMRYGGSWGEDGETGHFRLYAKSYQREPSETVTGVAIRDESEGVQAGFRVDWSPAHDSFTLQGDVYDGKIDQAPAARTFSGLHVLGRWQRELGADAQTVVQVYAERTERDHPSTFQQTLDTVDAIAQYGFKAAENHRATVGAGIRHSRDRVVNSAALAFLPATKNMRWSRVFAQDQISLSPQLDLTLSGSLEHNPYTGTEILPSVRVAWQPSSNATWWTSLSRAIRAPSRIDREFFAPAQPPFVIAGGPDFVSEVTRVFELGYRAQPTPFVTYSLTAFHHAHSRLRSLTPTASGLQIENNISGHTRGLGGWATWRVNERWRLSGGGVLLRSRRHLEPGASDAGGLAALGNDPTYWGSLHSSVDLTPRHAWELGIRRVGALPNPHVPAYTAVDTRLAWQAHRDLELSLAVHNLFDKRHAEWGPAANRVEVLRSLSFQLRWQM
jgi:iron complex outermembrane receptor protein